MKTVTTLCLVLVIAAAAAAQQPAPAPVRVLTNEGSVLHGAVAGGTLVVKTTFGGDLRIDARRVQSLVGTTLTLDDGSVLHGTLGGQVLLASAFGTLTIPGDRVTEIQGVRATGAPAAPAAATSSAAPPPVAKAAPPPKAVAGPPKPISTSVQLVNETRRHLNVCLNDETPCLQLAPYASTSRTMPIGPLRLRVESTTTLGFVMLATGSFERTVQIEPDSVVRVIESDFR